MKNTKSADSLFSLTLILILAICSFLMLFYEASAYQKINDVNSEIDNTHLPYIYILNKLRSGNDIKCVDNEIIINRDKEEIHIYKYNDYLYELTTLSGADIDKAAGEKLFEIDDFKADILNEKVSISYEVSGTRKNLFYSLRGQNNE